MNTGEVSPHFYVTPGLYLYVCYSAARKKLRRESFVVEEVKITPIHFFVGQEH